LRSDYLALDIVTVVTSAAVGSIVAAGITVLGQFLERRARRKELLLKKAIEIAEAKTKNIIDISEKTGVNAIIYDTMANVGVYYRALEYLINKGDLPADVKSKLEKEEKRLKKEKTRLAKE
jgi:hypothetical protein